MRSTISKAKAKPSLPAYPCLKKNSFNGLVVLFTAPQTGVLLFPAGSRFGEHCHMWSEQSNPEHWALLEGDLVLSNEGAE